MVQDLNIAVSGAQREHPDGQGGFYLELNKTTLHFVRRNPPATRLDAKQKPIFTNAGSSLLAEVFSADFFDISCMRKAPGAEGARQTPGKQGPGSSSVSSPASSNVTSPAIAAAAFLDHFRLRAKTDDLSIGRDSDAFPGLQPATLSATNDAIAQKIPSM